MRAEQNRVCMLLVKLWKRIIIVKTNFMIYFCDIDCPVLTSEACYQNHRCGCDYNILLCNIGIQSWVVDVFNSIISRNHNYGIFFQSTLVRYFVIMDITDTQTAYRNLMTMSQWKPLITCTQDSVLITSVKYTRN